MYHTQNNPEPLYMPPAVADVKEFLDDDPRDHPVSFSCVRPPRRDVERRLASVLNDPGFGTFARIQRVFDRMTADFDD